MIKKYEYIKVRCELFTNPPCSLNIDIREINKYGQLGWQLITYTFVNSRPAFAYFMREIPTETTMEIVDSFYSLAPHYRTKKMLVTLIDGKYPKMSVKGA